MPIYEYVCKRCGQLVELLQRMGTNEAGILCPQCGENQLVKKISVVSSPAKSTPIPSSTCGPGCGSCG